MDLTAKSDADLDQMIANHERKAGGTALPRYKELLGERARRAELKPGLSPERSLKHLKQTAIEQVCTTYGSLAKASGLEWSQARRQMNGARGHLEILLELCHSRELPLLTAICVNQDLVARGELGEEALAGFAAGARRLGFSFGDERAFHQRCRDECWQWGREQAGKAAS